MGTFNAYVVVTDKKGEPLRSITVECLDTTEFTPASPQAQEHVVATATTDEAGEALFSDLDDTKRYYCRARHKDAFVTLALPASAGGAMSAHDLGGAFHTADTLADLNTKVSDATLDDSSAARTPTAHKASHQNGGADEVAAATPGANAIPKASAAGKLAAGWGGAASTIATLNASVKVVENPANATTTPTASKIPIADGSGDLDSGWIKDGVRDVRVVWVDGDADTTGQKEGNPTCPAGTVVKVEVLVNNNVTCGATSLIVDIHKVLAANKNTDGTGTTLYTTQANRPTVTNGNRYVNATLPNVTAIADGDALIAYVDQAGTSVLSITIIVIIRRT